MEYNIANILISFAIISSVVVDSGSKEKNKRTGTYSIFKMFNFCFMYYLSIYIYYMEI